MRSLYKEYRPKKFEEVVGQEVVKKILSNSILQNKINHSYLFYGIRGTGKTTLARIFAKALNCENRQGFEPCGVCQTCKEINNGSNFDVIEMDAATNNGVDEIRSINEKSNYSTTSAKFKIYIIDEVHGLSRLAFNALLKTLEEPPKNTIFLLATTEIHKIPETILSRTIILNLELIEEKDIIENLEKILRNEKIEYEKNSLKYISFISGGSMRDAISNLESIILYSDIITEKTVINTLRVLKFDDIEDIINSKISIVDIFESRKIDYLKLTNLLINYLTSKIRTLNSAQRRILNDLIEITIHINDPIIIKMALINIFELKDVNTKNIEDNKLDNNENIKKDKLKNSEVLQEEKKDNETQNTIEVEFNSQNIVEFENVKVITDLFNSKHYLTVFFTQDENSLKYFRDKYDYLTSYLNKKRWMNYLNILLDSTIYLANDKAIIIGFSNNQKYNSYKLLSLEKEMMFFLNELFGKNVIVLPVLDKQWNQLNNLFLKLKKEGKVVEEKLEHPMEKEKSELAHLFGNKLVIENE